MKVPRSRPVALDTEQAARLVQLLQGHEFEPMFRLALAAGIRPGEYTGLRWEDVDWKSKRLTVRQGIWQVSRSDVRVIGVKSHRSERPISLVDEEIALLRDHRRQQAALQLRAGAVWEDRGLVFTNDRGRPLDQYRLRRSFYALLRAAELPKVNLYSLRRTMASIMHALGVPPKVIASRMGHADTQVLFKHYIREFEAQDAAAAESMAAAIREARRTGHRHAEGDC